MSIAADVKAIVDGGEEADDILRASLAALHAAAGPPWSAIAFVEEGQMVVGPLIGVSEGAPEPALAVPIVYRGDTVASLWFGAAPPAEVAAELDRVAALLAPYCLVGWDTGGEEWVP